MEAVISGGGSSSESTVVSKEEETAAVVVEQISFEVSDESELELGLGLSLGVNSNNNNNNKNSKQIPRFLTAKDLKKCSSSSINGGSPSSASSCSSLGLRPPSSSNNNNNNVSAGTKRAASPTAASQVVGWPPIRAYRMNSMANQAKSTANGDNDSEFDEMKQKDKIFGGEEKGNGNCKERAASKNNLFVKVNMDGVAIGRKVDLNAHSSYESLARALEEMFSNRAAEKSNGEELMLMPKTTRPSKLLDGSSDFVLTYEDKDGDWMLVGDVPWGMFTTSVKRLKIMRTSDANGLAPRSEERSAKQRSRPI